MRQQISAGLLSSQFRSPKCFPPPTWAQHHNYGFDKLNTKNLQWLKSQIQIYHQNLISCSLADFKPNTSVAFWKTMQTTWQTERERKQLPLSRFTSRINQTAAETRRSFRVKSIRGTEELRGAERFRVTTTVWTRPCSHGGKSPPTHTYTRARTHICTHTNTHRTKDIRTAKKKQELTNPQGSQCLHEDKASHHY